MRGVKYSEEIVKQARELRRAGFTYAEIADQLGQPLPKPTVSTWCRGIVLSEVAEKRRRVSLTGKLEEARRCAVANKKAKRAAIFRVIKEKNECLLPLLKSKVVAKMILVMLYQAEGGKTHNRATVTFGNSDPRMIRLFLQLLHRCYRLKKSKFRCTVMCRADQDTAYLRRFWHQVTSISLTQFYSPRIDPRSYGSVTKKREYKGVCRIDYFSSAVYNDIVLTAEVLMGP